MRSFRNIISLTRVNNADIKLLGSGPRLLVLPCRQFSNAGPTQENQVESTQGAVESTQGAVEPLVDSYGRRHNYLRISLTERCNLRCQYCMPAEGVRLSSTSALLSRAELRRVARVLVAAGVDKVRLTGGEPTLRADLADVVGELCEVGVRRVALTTNGLVLTRRLPALQRAGLTALNISLDSLRPQRYEQMARRPGLSRVLAGIDLALQLGYRPVKINVVLMKGFNDDEICDFVEYTRDREVEVRFIEFMPFSGNKWDDSKLVPYREALRSVFQTYPELTPAPPRDNDTATVWQVPGYSGSVGFIHSMTQHFCSSCNRLRLTADGNLKVCLFGAAEVSLRDAMRAGATDTQLDSLVRGALLNKKPSHAVRRVAARQYCTGPFSHLDGEGRARMVDVGDKQVTRRAAAATCVLEGSARLLRLLRAARLPKGDALSVAQVAGALGAKQTAALLPLCHALPLDCVRVRLDVRARDVLVRCEASARARTGVEMEALVGAAVAALALYDMCKSVDKHMRIHDLRVEYKRGGRSDFGPAPDPTPAPDPNPAPPPVRPYDRSPRPDPNETYAPSDIANF